ncbi:hypothetical protein ACF0H5_009804 [Mactra antiquata]
MKSTKRASESALQSKDAKKHKSGEDVANKNTTNSFLSPVRVFILQAGIEKTRMYIFQNQLGKYGGQLYKDFTSDVTHLVVDDKMEPDRLCRLLKVDNPPENVNIVKSSWLSACFKDKHLVEISDYVLDCSKHILKKNNSVNENMPSKSTKCTPNPIESTDSDKLMKDDAGRNEFPKVGAMFSHKAKTCPVNTEMAGDDDSDYCPSGDERDSDQGCSTSDVSTPSTSPKKNLPVGNWVCAQSSKVSVENCNKHITDKLEEMVRTYESTNDKWRAFGYQKAIQVLRKQSKPITSYEEAMALPSIGKRLAEKIWEIAESGDLRKLNELKSNDDIKVIELFKDVWGAGAHTARAWYQQGFRTLEDLRTKANLTYQQKIGLRCYDDFLDRMPRSEAGEIEQVVKKTAEDLQPGIIAQACGSYRRGKSTCGDVDVLVTHPDGKSHKGIFSKLLSKLKQDGFLTDDLVTAEDNGNQKKYLGVCKLPGENTRYRRIDIIVVPYDEYACALVYFTGSAHFNRSLRHLAKKMGMSLSEHSLNTGVVRHGSEKIYEGTPLPTPTEESVFTHLGVPMRPPEERDH